MTAVTPTTATVSATAWLIGNQRCSTGTSASAIVVPPKAADKNPAKVTPICTADKRSANLGTPSKPNPNDPGGVAVLDIHQAR